MLPIIVALLSFAMPEPVVSEIPLSDMYGHDIPGTKDVFDLYDVPALREKLVSSFSQRVHAGPVLIMLGPPKHAAKMVALMQDGVYSPQRQFTEGSDLCLVVCSYASGAQFILDKVERGWSKIRISWHAKYTFDEGAHFWHVVIIPLGNCKPGDYDVEMVRTDKRFNPDFFVSKSTSFQVLEREKRRVTPPGFAPNFSGKSL